MDYFTSVCLNTFKLCSSVRVFVLASYSSQSFQCLQHGHWIRLSVSVTARWPERTQCDVARGPAASLDQCPCRWRERKTQCICIIMGGFPLSVSAHTHTNAALLRHSLSHNWSNHTFGSSSCVPHFLHYKNPRKRAMAQCMCLQHTPCSFKSSWPQLQ